MRQHLAIFMSIALVLGLTACLTTESTQESSIEADNQKTGDVEMTSRGAACDIGAPADSAFVITGKDEESNTAILLNGQALTPAGMVADTDKFPWGVAVSPDSHWAFVTNADGNRQGIQVFDISGEEIKAATEILLTPVGHGIVVSSDGETLYVAGGANAAVYVYSWDGTALTKQRQIPASSYIASVALSQDESYLYALSPTQSMLNRFALADDSRQKVQVGYYPYDVVLSADGQTAYVSNWGGNSVSVVDTASMTVTEEIGVELHPEGMALVGGGSHLLVANSDSDTISVIDAASNTVVETVMLDPENSGLFGWVPNDVAAHPDPEARYAYVASADHNAIDVIDIESWQVAGSIPTAQYPTRIAFNSSGDKLAIINSKGWGARPGQKTNSGLYGVLQVVDTPANLTELEVHTRQVEENYNRPAEFYPNNDCERVLPLPLTDGEISAIEHVILVVKENKTYDEILGDLMGEEGDEWHSHEYARLYGENVTLETGETVNVTPNAHALARNYVDIVNYYSDAEVSLQGHMWVTQADCNDYVEKLRFDRVPGTGVEPITYHGNGSIFEHLDNNGINFRVYGEVVNFGPKELEKWIDKIDLKYPFWSMGAPDVKKAEEVIREWALAAETGEESLFPPFIFIVLPNDHNNGAKGGSPHPRSMVADNDHAMGMLIEALSHSPFWEKSLLIALQDDPQSAVGDHIDAHRSICFMASPWIKRGYRSTIHYSFPSVWRTIELILGVEPINRNSASAPPMVDVFTDEMDTTPYTAIKPTMPLIFNPEETEFAKEAEQWDWRTFDGHKGLGDHVWRYIMGDEARPADAKRIDD